MPTDVRTFGVVCLGGSARGLDAYLGILRPLPADTVIAFVIAPHRGVEHAQLLPRILSAATAMPVAEVTQGMQLEPNRVYIMPPGKKMTVNGGMFNLQTTPAARSWPKTISGFMLSLAEAWKPRGGGHSLRHDHDRSAALQAVKAAGRITFAQPTPAETDMPRRAVDRGYVDMILPPAEFAKALLDLPPVDDAAGIGYPSEREIEGGALTDFGRYPDSS